MPAEGIVVLDEEFLLKDIKTFKKELLKSLEIWHEQGYKIVNLEIPIANSEFVPVIIDTGFKYHYCGTEFLVLNKQLAGPELIAPRPHHFIGVGGIVLNDAGQILVVVDKYYSNKYKFPGGFVDSKENLAAAAVREIYEETGIRAEVQTLAFFRQVHDNIFRKAEFSDIYFVFKMKAKSSKIRTQESEIEEARWMDIDEFLESENVSRMSKQTVQRALKTEGISIKTCEEFGICSDRVNYDGLELFLPK